MMNALATAFSILIASRNVALLGSTVLLAKTFTLPWGVAPWNRAHLLGVYILLLDDTVLCYSAL